MSKFDNSGPAFPFIAWRSPDGMVGMEQSGGMSLRDWFAGQAIVFTAHEGSTERAAEWAYQLADAMLAAREPKP